MGHEDKHKSSLGICLPKLTFQDFVFNGRERRLLTLQICWCPKMLIPVTHLIPWSQLSSDSLMERFFFPADQAAEQKETCYATFLTAAYFKISSMYIRAG